MIKFTVKVLRTSVAEVEVMSCHKMTRKQIEKQTLNSLNRFGNLIPFKSKFKIVTVKKG